jgi:arsenite methyltransferase
MTAALPTEMREDLGLISACVAGAASIAEIEEMLRQAGFTDVCITPQEESREIVRRWVTDLDVGDYVMSAAIEARKSG